VNTVVSIALQLSSADESFVVFEVASQLSVTPYQAIGIPIALAGAVFLALGAQFQSRGVGKVQRATARGGNSRSVNMGQLWKLLQRPSWVIGTVMLGLAIVLQLVSLGFAPLIVVQPLGVTALVITAIVNARITKTRLGKRSVQAITLCVAGIGLFVIFAALFAVEMPISYEQLVIILVILLIVLIALLVAFVTLRKRFSAGFYIVGAGVLFGFVATLAKVVINRLINGNFDWLVFVGILGLLMAAALGTYFVQNAHVSGPPDLVIAGLTVIDPLIAVGIGIVVLHEAADAPLYGVIAFIVSAAIAIIGVWQLAKNRPHGS
jgi:drug/metabolite transporter (DMT)-like permease